MGENNPGRGPGFMDVPQPFYAPDVTGRASAGNPDEDPDRAKEAADEAEANRNYYGRESFIMESISRAETPQELFTGLRMMLEMAEDGDIPNGLSERYTPPRAMADMYQRWQLLRTPVEQLVKMGVIKDYDPTTGKAKIARKHLKYAAYAIYVEDLSTEEETRYGTKLNPKFEYVFGTPEQRKEMAEAYRIATKELEVRDIMGEHISLRMSLDFRDSLEEISRMMHSGRVSKFKSEHLKALFNLPGVDELGTSPENKRLGEQIEEAMLLNLIMLKSSSKEQLKYLLAKPRVKQLIHRMAERRGQTDAEWVLANIGDYERWDPMQSRKVGKNWRKERADGRRKGVAQWANIPAWEGNPGEFSDNKEKDFINNIVGELVGSQEAAWIAATMMRVLGAYSSEGYIAFPGGRIDDKGNLIMEKGKSALNLGEGRYMSSDDFGKMLVFLFNMKEGLAGRSSGLRGMRGKIPDMEMNLFDWMAVEVDSLPLMRPDGTIPDKNGKYHVRDANGNEVIEDPDGTEIKQKRSVWDAWLGTAEQPYRSVLDNGVMYEITDPAQQTAEINAGRAKQFEIVDNKGVTRNVVVSRWVEEEEGRPFGDVRFDTAEREVHGTFTIMQWLEGNERGPVGVLIDALKMEFRYDEDFRLNELKKKKKYHGIVLNPPNLTKGSPHLYGDVVFAGEDDYQYGFTAIDLIKLNFMRNLMIARIHSESFNTGILGVPIKLPKPGGSGTAEVPAAVLVRAFVREILKDNPRDEKELEQYYIDENERLRNLGEEGNQGTSADIAALVNEKFEPERPVKKSGEADADFNKRMRNYEFKLKHMDKVGIVKGKNAFI